MEENSHSKRIRVDCRPALESDTPAMLELTALIWEGSDYVPKVWAEWLADPNGRLLVAEYQGRLVGLVKLSRLAEDDWWLQGLRVHPEFEGRGVAAQLHDAALQVWQEIGQGTLRLATASFRLPVQHLCDRSGFHKVGEFTPFAVTTSLIEPIEARLSSQLADLAEAFTPLKTKELAEALSYALPSESLRLNYGQIDMAWEFAPLRLEYLVQSSAQGRAWWWRDRRGLLAVYEDQDNQGTSTLMPQFVACELAALADCLVDFHRLAQAKGYTKAAWLVALQPSLAPALQAAGFQRDWEHALFLYEKSYSAGD
jgi:GNAT superfamily N-acetyltransferase